MNRKELAIQISKRVGIGEKEAERALLEMTSIIEQKVMIGEPVHLVGFGKFSLTKRKPRITINPQNRKEKCMVPAMCGIRFKPGVPLKKRIRLAK